MTLLEFYQELDGVQSDLPVSLGFQYKGFEVNYGLDPNIQTGYDKDGNAYASLLSTVTPFDEKFKALKPLSGISVRELRALIEPMLQDHGNDPILVSFHTDDRIIHVRRPIYTEGSDANLGAVHRAYIENTSGDDKVQGSNPAAIPDWEFRLELWNYQPGGKESLCVALGDVSKPYHLVPVTEE